MPTILMHAENGEALGFLRVVGEDPLAGGASARECVFRESPGSHQVFDRPVIPVGPGLDDIAHAASVRVDGEHVHLRLELLNAALLLDLVDRRGRWCVEVGGQRKLFGACEVLPQ
jgi:hypothetical protein